MTLVEAAARLGVTPDTLRQQIHRGALRAKKVGRDWHVSVREIERYRRQSRREAKPMCSQCGKDLTGIVSHSHGRMPGQTA